MGLDTRAQAKVAAYCMIYGGGDSRLGEITGGGRVEGKQLKAKFLKNIPAFKHLLDAVEQKVKSLGYLRGLDGRELPARSSHSALNLLLQSAGAVIMKQALIEFCNTATLDYEMHANVHDEVQFSCAREDADILGNEFVASIKTAGHTLNFKCPLDGEYHIGLNWKETH